MAKKTSAPRIPPTTAASHELAQSPSTYSWASSARADLGCLDRFECKRSLEWEYRCCFGQGGAFAVPAVVAPPVEESKIVVEHRADSDDTVFVGLVGESAPAVPVLVPVVMPSRPAHSRIPKGTIPPLRSFIPLRISTSQLYSPQCSQNRA